MADAPYAFVGTRLFNIYNKNLKKFGDVLIIELKKGKLAIG